MQENYAADAGGVKDYDPRHKPQHDPVLLTECLEYLGLGNKAVASGEAEGKVVVDCTLGLGGHSSEILKRIGPKGFLYAFDKDERNIKIAEKRLREVTKEIWMEKSGTKEAGTKEPGTKEPGRKNNFKIFHDSFSSLTDRLRGEGALEERPGEPGVVDAILFDLGLSSPHIDDAERGFSFQKDGPLDMRFDAGGTTSKFSGAHVGAHLGGRTAADLLNKLPEKELGDIFYRYGEERASRKLARAVVEFRKSTPFATTTQLTQLVETALGRGKPGKHRAAKIFQALRIAVNEELEVLELGLNQAIELLAPNGRVVVLSYHSLEDRITKRIFKQLATDLRDPNDPFGRRVHRSKSLSLLTKKPITPTEREIKENPRARSAKLRAAEKIPR